MRDHSHLERTRLAAGVMSAGVGVVPPLFRSTNRNISMRPRSRQQSGHREATIAGMRDVEGIAFLGKHIALEESKTAVYLYDPML